MACLCALLDQFVFKNNKNLVWMLKGSVLKLCSSVTPDGGKDGFAPGFLVINLISGCGIGFSWYLVRGVDLFRVNMHK